MKRSTILLAVITLLGGCGGGGGSDQFVAGATLACLSDEGFSDFSTDPDDLDLIAEEYEDRAARFDAGGGEVTVIVTENESQAKNAAQQYELFGGLVEEATIRRDGNPVIAAGALEDSTLARIEGCLSTQSDGNATAAEAPQSTTTTENGADTGSGTAEQAASSGNNQPLAFEEDTRLGTAELGKVTCNETRPAARPDGKQFDQPGDGRIDPARPYLLTMETSCGNIVLQLDPVAAPKTVSAIVFLTREGFYDGTPFHRVVDNFVIQGGDPTGTGTGGPGYTMAEEPPSDRNYLRGDFAMAKTSAPNSTGSQFFIVTGDPAPLNSSPTYTYLGHVVEGFAVAQKIESFNQGDGPPTRDLYLLKATITET